MKVVLFTCLFCPMAAFSQQVEMVPEASKIIRKNVLSLPATTEPQAQLVETLPNGNRVYALPQDNMPCVVPAPAQQPAASAWPVLVPAPTMKNMPVAGLRKTPLIPPAVSANSPMPPVRVPLPDWRQQLPKLNK